MRGVSCPTPAEIQAYVDREATANERTDIEQHLLDCPQCRDLLALAPSFPGDAWAPGEPLVSGLKVGRFVVDRLIGAGGMGVVYAAHDPDLDRRVALKLLREESEERRERLAREAQALARVASPNVCAVYEIGSHEGRLYIAMELIEGRTLGGWARARRRDWREIVGVYAAAARGLAAAHAAGVIHRDFKPENVLVGDSGCVRVTDFGLATWRPGAAPAISPEAAVDSGLTQSGVALGTPLYMSPEQHRGAVADERSDQFSFAAALFEALGGRPAYSGTTEAAIADEKSAGRIVPFLPAARVPRWLDRLVRRGLAPRPEDRLPSMDLFARALDRSSVRRTRWLIAAAALVVAASAVAALAIGRAETAPPLCTGSDDELAKAWNGATRVKLVDHLRQLGPFGAASAEPLAAELDTRGAEWIAAHRDSCLAHQRAELTTELYERRLGCLARSRAGLAATAEVLGSTSLDDLNHAVAAARSEQRPGSCDRDLASGTSLPNPALAPRIDAVAQAISRARVLGVARRPDAMAAVTSAAAQARETDYLPLITEALLVQARVASLVDPSHAVAPAEEALADAIALRDDPLTVEAFARLAFAGISVIEPIARRAGHSAKFARALLYNNIGAFRSRHGDRSGARESFAKALEESREIPGEPDAELTSIPFNLALVADSQGEAAGFAERAADARERRLGANHADTLAARMLTAMLTADRHRAIDLLRDACGRYERWQPHLVVPVAGCNYELGLLAEELGDRPAAIASMRRATGDPDLAPISSAFVDELAGAPGDAAAGAAHLQELAATLAARPSYWQRRQGADAYTVAARGWERAGEREKAHIAWETARQILVSLGMPIYGGRLAWVTREAER